ncbi:MAG: DUF4402 domain-containing protein [Fidelibacterota bacterium]
MLGKFCSKSISLLSVIFVLCFVGNASAVNITTNATVVSAVTVAEVTPLDFGSFVPDPVGDTITFNAGGTIAAGSGATVLLGGEVGGVASTNGPTLGSTVQVFVTGGNIASGVNTMAVQVNCLGPGGALGTLDGSCTFTSAGGLESVQIGGVLTVAPAQPAGAYTGFVSVTAGFF